MTKPLQENINGILLLDKPTGMTSNSALQSVKRLFGAKKAGHTGSLDPRATGMLPICFGEATKLCQFLLESDKFYRVKAHLGVRTTTCDADGEVVATHPVENVTAERVTDLLTRFTGLIEQIPPMFSAVKINGKPLYKLARRGIEVERQPRAVTIHSLALIEFTDTSFTLDVHCTKGTYVRTLIDDLGLLLGCGAHVVELHRTAVSPYQHARMFSLDELESIRAEQGLSALRKYLLPIETSAQNFPAISLSTSAAFYLKMGHPVMAGALKARGFIRIFADDGQFLGIGEMLEDGRVSPRRLINYGQKIA
jgi:tRNA pseudouridine55 synthase